MATLTLQGRELVVEIEKVQTVRRTARTKNAVCSECGSSREFVELAKIAAVFEVAPSRFLKAIRANACHITIAEHGVQVCVTSLVTLLRTASSLSPSGRFQTFTGR